MSEQRYDQQFFRGLLLEYLDAGLLDELPGATATYSILRTDNHWFGTVGAGQEYVTFDLPASRVAQLAGEDVGSIAGEGSVLGAIRVSEASPEMWRSLLDEAIEFARAEFTLLEEWELQKDGSRDNEDRFAGFINDLSPDDYERAFGDLPDSRGFFDRLRRVHHDCAPSLEPDQWQLYFVPSARTAVSADELVALAAACLETKVAEIARADDAGDEKAMAEVRTIVSGLEYRFVGAQSAFGEYEHDDLLNDMWSDYCAVLRPDVLRAPGSPKGNWWYALRESCYYIATSYELRDWLLQDWYGTNSDLEALYRLYVAGGRVAITKDRQTAIVSARHVVE